MKRDIAGHYLTFLFDLDLLTLIQIYVFMCRRVLLLAVLLTASFSFFAQSYFGVKADAGVSKMGPGKYTYYHRDSYFEFSWRAGLTYSYRFKGFSALGIDLLYSNIQGKEVELNTNTSPNYTTTSTQNLSYIAVPLYYTAHIKRFSVSAGGCLMFFKNGWLKEIFSGNMNGANYEYSRKTNTPAIPQRDAGIVGGISYKLWKQLVVSLNGYYSLTPILENSQPIGISYSWNGRIMQFTGGLTYYVYATHGHTKTAKPGNAILDMD
jgi:hypothetical protein